MDRITGPRFVGNTDAQGPRGQASHLVRDTSTWTASCGKRIAEAIEFPADRVRDLVTCGTCLRAIDAKGRRS